MKRIVNKNINLSESKIIQFKVIKLSLFITLIVIVIFLFYRKDISLGFLLGVLTGIIDLRFFTKFVDTINSKNIMLRNFNMIMNFSKFIIIAAALIFSLNYSNFFNFWSTVLGLLTIKAVIILTVMKRIYEKKL